jgi:ketosteroid isomerase-like protein
MLKTNTAARAESPIANSVVQLTMRSELQAKLFNTGDMERWLKLIALSDDFTLMQPFGGPTTFSFDDSPANMAHLSQSFRNGTATLELEASYTSDDLVVLVYIERQTGEVHGLPDQDWSLRVTQVYRRDDGHWKMVHRHADPLVRRVSLQHAAALARGDAEQAAVG